MENHVIKLHKHCRVCKKKIVLKKGYVNPKACTDFTDTLKNACGILPNEDQNIYPSKLCSTCTRQLQKTQSGSGFPAKEIALFMPHDDNDCEICLNRQPKNIVDDEVHFKFIDSELLKCNLIKYSNTHSERIYYQPLAGIHGIFVPITLKLNLQNNMSWKLYVNGNMLAFNNEPLCQLPEFINDISITDYVSKFKSFNICPGNTEYADVLQRRVDFREPFAGDNNERTAYVESTNGFTKLVKEEFNVIRHVNCSYLVTSNQMCEKCKSYKKVLSTYRHRTQDAVRKKSDNVAADSSTNYRYLKIAELEERCKNLQISRRAAIKEAAQLSLKLHKIVSEDGAKVTQDQHSLLHTIIKSNPTNFQEGSPQWLLWQQQSEQAGKSDSRGMRWHPLIIRWCLSIYHTSPSAYRQISNKRNGFLILPHVNTLKKYINYTEASSGFNADVIAKLIEDSKLAQLEDYQKNVSILFDEIKIKTGLIFKRSSGKLVGFTEMGDLNEEIRELQDRVNEKETDERDFAKYINVFMVRGIFSNLCFPFGYHASLGFTADQLFPVVWEATDIIESLGFKVRSWVCDGASPNRKFFDLNTIDGIPNNYYWTNNSCTSGRKIFFISDAPHLLKTTRNNLENSHGNRNSRNLHWQNQELSWQHVISVYEWDLGQNRAAFGLRMLSKLREEHINLSPKHRMKVKYATQVLSQSVANALRMQGRHDTMSTINFIETFNKVFDCLNVMRTKCKGNYNKLPYKDVNDPRFEFLESVLVYLDKWRSDVDGLVNTSKEEKNRMCVSRQTDFGWHLTIKSFVELAKLLLQEPGVNFLLSEKFSQDPVEEHFARHRRAGGCNENPTLAQFQQQEVALGIIKSDLISDLRGNTQGRPDNRLPIDVNDQRLPRKRSNNRR